ncbi:cellulose biosynthesis protein BcsD [Caulobacter radicis]|uniref:Cellulose synthase n=1 Tax=Caulobacter radicis TaxID=2172650 RepID=A0A2T9J9F5_9CAUL|nr:cellulose biosynthesis protein BcsD [Caulobacter radicis]PVM78473.1 hypothetical protein DDF65_15620 [Caulobacter radicis]
MSASEFDPRSKDLGYLRRRRVSGQWAPFLAALADELAAVADKGAVKRFLCATGERMARRHALPKLETLDELEARLNEILDAMDWGWVQLAVAEDHILITHGACPNVLEDDDERAWPPLMAELLAGAYGAWLAAQGSPGGVTTCRDPLASPLVFEHRV